MSITITVPFEGGFNGGTIVIPLLIPDGSVTAPAIAFTNSPTTGIYSPGPNSLAIATNGKNAITWDANQNTLITSNTDGQGLSALLQFGGQTNTFPALKAFAGSLHVRAADDSATYPLVAASFNSTNATATSMLSNGGITLGTAFALTWLNQSVITSPADGTLLFTNNAGTGFTSLTLGTSTSTTAALLFGNKTRITGPVDGKLLVQTNAGSSASLVTGLYVGTTTSAGWGLVRGSAAGTWRAQNGDNTANGGFEAGTFVLTNADSTLRIGTTAAGLAPSGAGALIFIAGSVAAATINTDQTFSFMGSTTNNGSTLTLRSLRTSTTVSGATTTVAVIPAGSCVIGVSSRVTTNLGGAITGYSLGDTIAGATAYAANAPTTSGTTTNYTSYTTTQGTWIYASNTNLVATSVPGVGFTSGVIETVIWYYTLVAPTS